MKRDFGEIHNCGSRDVLFACFLLRYLWANIEDFVVVNVDDADDGGDGDEKINTNV